MPWKILESEFHLVNFVQSSDKIRRVKYLFELSFSQLPAVKKTLGPSYFVNLVTYKYSSTK